jgi:hypothetical protein
VMQSDFDGFSIALVPGNSVARSMSQDDERFDKPPRTGLKSDCRQGFDSLPSRVLPHCVLNPTRMTRVRHHND